MVIDALLNPFDRLRIEVAHAVERDGRRELKLLDRREESARALHPRALRSCPCS